MIAEAIIYVMVFHSPVYMSDPFDRVFATLEACEAEAKHENKRLGPGSLYYECIPRRKT